MARTVVWFRRDLRLADHAPLARAARRGEVVPVFVFDRALLHHPETGSARVAFLLRVLAALDADLRDRGGRLILRSGDPVTVLPDLVRATGADGIYAHLDFERICGRVRDARLNAALARQNLKIRWFEPPGATPDLLAYPDYRAFWFAEMRRSPEPAPARVPVPGAIASEPLPDLVALGLVPDGKPVPDGSAAAARQLLQGFLADKAERYYWQLSYPGAAATTGLSPYLKFGAISPREVLQTLESHPAHRHPQNDRDRRIARSIQQAVARLRWGGGFAQRFRYLPQLELRSLYRRFDEDGWDFDEAAYRAWQQGYTGFPIVDAAARCLQATGGWLALNFRSRAIYASFLSNLLGIDWRYGALHFMRHLLDGDCPIDHYQWAMQAGVTHCLDKSWTRIYNPGQVAIDRCDPDGAFVRRWVPEVAHLPAERLGNPPPLDDYPAAIVDYPEARRRRMARLQRQRATFAGRADIAPFLARIPEDATPFGSDRLPCDVAWARAGGSLELFPEPLDLDVLDAEGNRRLRTWFVAHVAVRPARSRRRRSRPDPNARQLCLPLGDCR